MQDDFFSCKKMTVIFFYYSVECTWRNATDLKTFLASLFILKVFPSSSVDKTSPTNGENSVRNSSAFDKVVS